MSQSQLRVREIVQNYCQLANSKQAFFKRAEAIWTFQITWQGMWTMLCSSQQGLVGGLPMIQLWRAKETYLPTLMITLRSQMIFEIFSTRPNQISLSQEPQEPLQPTLSSKSNWSSMKGSWMCLDLNLLPLQRSRKYSARLSKSCCIQDCQQK